DFDFPAFAAIASNGGSAKAIPKPCRNVRRDNMKFFTEKVHSNIARTHLAGKVNGRFVGRFIP
ncbi:MAG: hypothetical protein VCA18_11410, partial [Opitutales bacterium]